MLQKLKKQKIPIEHNEKSKGDKISPIDQWVALNRILKFYKVTIISLSASAVVMLFVIISLLFQDPVVVVINENQRIFLKGEKKSIAIGEPEIKQVVSEYIKLRYNWDDLDTLEITKNLSPLITDGLKKKIRSSLIQLKEKEFRDKKISQEITKIEVQVTEKKVIAYFDKILRIDGIPLVVPTKIEFSVIRGKHTKWNPSGVYVDGYIESVGK